MRTRGDVSVLLWNGFVSIVLTAKTGRESTPRPPPYSPSPPVFLSFIGFFFGHGFCFKDIQLLLLFFGRV